MTSAHRITIIRNARAARGPVNHLARLLEADGSTVDIQETFDFEGGLKTAREAAATSSLVVAAGGDGTLLSTLSAALEADIPLAVLPLGTANDFAANMGMHHAEDVAASIIRRSKKRVDVVRCSFVDPLGEARTLPFVTNAGVGVLGDVSKRERSGAAGWMKRTFGNAAWPIIFGASWRATRDTQASIALGDVMIDAVLSSFEVCKVPSAGGITIAPDARVDSGILHAFYFGELSATTFLVESFRAFTLDRNRVRSRHVQYVSTNPHSNRAGAANLRRVHVAPKTPMAVHVQGEYVGTTPATFEMVEDIALEVFVPLAQPTFMPLPSWRPTSAGV